MKKIVKIVAIVVAVVLVAAFVAPMLLRGKIAQIVKREANEMLDARVDFEKLDISLLRHFPRASLDLKGLTVVGAGPFEGDTIVAANRISVVVNPMSLFGDDGFEVTKVILAEPALHAHKLADGKVNWDIVKASGEEPAAGEGASEEGSSSFSLSIRDFRISDATIRYEDDSTGMRFSTAPLSLRLRGDMSADQTDLDLRLTAGAVRLVSGGIPLLSDAEAELDAVIAADLKNNRFTFSRNRLRLNAIELTLDGWAEMKDDAVAMDITAGCDKVQFKDVLSLVPAFYTRDFRNLSASGELSMALWARGEMRGAALPAFELKSEVRNGSFQYSSLPKAVDGINIAARIANPGGVMDKTEVDLSKFTLRMAGNTLSASLYATNLASDPVFRAAADGRVDLGAVKEVYPLGEDVALSGLISADVKVSGRMSDVEKARYGQIGASGTFVVEKLGLSMPGLPAVHIRRAAATITPASMTLGEFGVTVGKSDLAANGQLTGYIGYLLRGDKLSGRLYVKSDLLDLNEIMNAMPADEETAGGEAAAQAPAESPAPAQALEVPRNLDLSLNTELQKVLFQKMTIGGITGEMRMADGTLSLSRLRMQLFGGTATASGSYSTADAAHPALAFNLGFTDASYARTFEQLEMVQRIVPLFEKAGGVYSMSLDMKMNLDQAMEPDLMSLDAQGELRSADIHIEQLKAFEVLAKTLGNDALSSIRAKDVVIPFSIRQGRLTTKPFDLKMGDVSLNLSGSTGLDQSIDYTAQVALPASATGGVLSKVNVGIGGTFTDPKITIGVKEAVEEAARNLIDEQVQKLTGNESLSEAVQEQAAKLREEARKAGEKLIAAAEEQRTKLVDAAKNPIAKLAAEKAGDKLVDEARKQADKLTAEAEAQIEKLASKAQ